MADTTTPPPPDGLWHGGRQLWESITDDHDLDAAQLAQLEEACRAKGRLDALDAMLQADFDPETLKQANATANLMKQLLAALRLPDAATGKRPQHRGPRGAQKPSVPRGNVSSLDRARARKTGT